MRKRFQQFLKRFFDVFLASLAILALLPAFAILWVIIKIDSKGPALIIQKRIGKNGKTFRVLKFRTMFHKSGGLEYRFIEDGFLQQTAENDDRITSVGRKIRKVHLDEIPQLFNVLIGQMSLVGPRPNVDLPSRNPKVDFKRSLPVRPGLTGLAQVSGGANISVDEEKYYDYKYIEDYSFPLDLRILFNTFVMIILSKPKSTIFLKTNN